MNLIAQGFTTGYVICKFIGLITSSNVLNNPYFLLAFTIIPLLYNGIIDPLLQSNIISKKDDLINFFNGACLTLHRLNPANETQSLPALPSAAPTATILLSPTVIQMLASSALAITTDSTIIDQVIYDVALRAAVDETTVRSAAVNLQRDWQASLITTRDATNTTASANGSPANTATASTPDISPSSAARTVIATSITAETKLADEQPQSALTPADTTHNIKATISTAEPTVAEQTLGH